MERIAARVILLLYFLLAFGFSTGPILEGAEEFKHFRFVNYLILEGRLPDPRTEAYGQFHQAPLYYAMMTPLSLLSGEVSLPDWAEGLNPFYGHLAFVANNDNKNVYLHPADQRFPAMSDPQVRAMRLMRWAGVLMGGLLLIIIYEAAALIVPGRVGLRLGALAFAASLPTFVYNTGLVSNDTLAFLLSGLALLLLLRQEIEGHRWELSAWLGLVMGAALLSKANTGFLVFPAGLATLLHLRRGWKHASLTLALTLAVAGWWYIRNYILYGDFIGARPVLESYGAYIAGGAFDLQKALELSPFAYVTFYARFGHGGIPASPWVYRFFDAFVLTLIGGGLLSARAALCASRGDSGFAWRPLLLVLVYMLNWLAMLIYFSGVTWFGNQGRYLMLGLTGWGLLAGAAFLWLPSRFDLPAALAGALILFSVAAYTLFANYLPALRPSPYVEPLHALDYRYGDLARLRGVSEDMLRVQPGEITSITLSWEALGPAAPGQDIQTYLHSLNSNLVRRDSYPGTGNLLAADFIPGLRWSEQYWIEIPADAEVQRVYPLVVGYTDMDTQFGIPAMGPDGAELTPVIGRIAVNGPIAENPQPLARFGESIGIEQPILQGQPAALTLCMPWIALAETPLDYQVFVHAVDPSSGVLLDQRDFQPLDWRYPSSAWATGERIIDCVTFETAAWPLTWELRFGFYDLNTGQRLPLTPLAELDSPAADYFRVLPPT